MICAQLDAQRPSLIAMVTINYYRLLFQLACSLSQLGSLEGLARSLHDNTPPPTSLPPLLLSLLTSLPPSTQLASEVTAMAVHICSFFNSSLQPAQVDCLFKAVQCLVSLHPLPLPQAMSASQLLKHCSHLSLPQSAVVSAPVETTSCD